MEGLHQDWASPKLGLDANTPRDKGVSLLFAGIGDARNLYATLVMITESELRAPSKRTFQIIVNDIMPHVIARNLVIWLLLDELTRMRILHWRSSMPYFSSSALQSCLQGLWLAAEHDQQGYQGLGDWNRHALVGESSFIRSSACTSGAGILEE